MLSRAHTSTVSVEVLDVTLLPGRRRLMGLAQLEVTLDGVGIVLQGVRILRRADGFSYVEPPCYRHTDGDYVPAVVLPIELEDAVARAVLERAGALLCLPMIATNLPATPSCHLLAPNT